MDNPCAKQKYMIREKQSIIDSMLEFLSFCKNGAIERVIPCFNCENTCVANKCFAKVPNEVTILVKTFTLGKQHKASTLQLKTINAMFLIRGCRKIARFQLLPF